MSFRHIINDFNYFGGIHCETSAVRKIFLYNEFDISEEMLFGLSGGIGFIYWYVKQMPAPVIGGRGGGRQFIEEGVKRVGAQLEIRRTTSSKKGHDWLCKKLDCNQPVVVYGDMAYLPYLGAGEDAHFGQHVFVIYGVDEENDIVYISDRGNKGVKVTIDDLKKARGSKFPPWPPQHAIFDFQFPDKLDITKERVLESLNQCVNIMLNPPISNIGINGFTKWANLVVKWPNIFPGEKLWDALYQGFIYIETGGTGGSAFRPMFCRYLDEIQSILNVDELDETIKLFNESALIWSEIADLYLPDEYPSLGSIKQLILASNTIFEKQKPDALELIKELNKKIEDRRPEIIQELKEASKFLPKIQNKILELREQELRAFTSLKRILVKIK